MYNVQLQLGTLPLPLRGFAHSTRHVLVVEVTAGYRGTRTLVTEALNRPTSVVVGDDGALYVSNNGVSVGTGEVLRIQP